MINVIENKVLGPLMLEEIELAEQRGRDAGRQEAMHAAKQEARQQAMQEGRRYLLYDLLTEKFGPLPAWAALRLQAATAEDLHAWARRVLHGATLEETLR